MAFTLITITGGPFTRPDGQPAQGTVTATLSERIQNGADVVEPTPITGTLDASGMLQNDTGLQPFTVEANNDPGTVPQGSTYEFVIETDGAPIDPFVAVVPYSAGGQTIDLSALMPAP